MKAHPNVPLANLNGQVMPLSEAKVPALDRGFLFGDGVYEVIRIYSGRPFLLDLHWDRLKRSLQGIRIQGVDLERLRERALDLILRAATAEALLYVQITRGAAATRSHFFPGTEVLPTELLSVTPYQDSSPSLRTEGASAITLPELRWSHCDLKTVSLLGNVLAAQAGKEAGVYETLFVSREGTVSEGSRANVFAVIEGTLRTMPNGSAILPGISRDLVLRLARANGITVVEQAFSAVELFQASEVFLTGTTSEVMPLVRVDGRVVGNGRPGPITLKLAGLYLSETRKTD